MRLATLSEKEIIITLIALALLLLFAFIFGTLMEKIKGPRVVGEILGGSKRKRPKSLTSYKTKIKEEHKWLKN